MPVTVTAWLRLKSSARRWPVISNELRFGGAWLYTVPALADVAAAHRARSNLRRMMVVPRLAQRSAESRRAVSPVAGDYVVAERYDGAASARIDPGGVAGDH